MNLQRACSSLSCCPTLDRAGVIASIGCALHCLAAPVLILASPAIAGVWAHPLTHLSIAALVMPIGLVAMRRGYRRHRLAWVLAVSGLGALLVLLGAAWPLCFPASAVTQPEFALAADCCRECCPSVAIDKSDGSWSLRIPAAAVLTLLGGIGLITGHVANLRCDASGGELPSDVSPSVAA